MSTFDPHQFLFDVFLRLRNSGFQLGVDELLDAFQAVEGGWGSADSQRLMSAVRLLWCKSPAEQEELKAIWVATSPPAAAGSRVRPNLPPSTSGPQPKPGAKGSDQEMGPASTTRRDRTWGMLPLVSPLMPAPVENTALLEAYWPISRSQMVYGWRYLRRPFPDGPEDVLDVGSTVERAARQGFYLAPVYRRRDRNHAHLLLLIDQGGSMVPFHRFTRDLLDTARDESTIEQVDAFYFNNVPAENMYLDSWMTAPLATKQVLENCYDTSSVLIVSDAGAARGHRRLERIRATTGFLSQLKRRTSLIAWLNPMPADRWPGTSAQIIAHLVRMFQMDADGFANAVDVARGQLLLS